MNFPLLSLIVFLPIIGAIVLIFVPNRSSRDIKAIAVFISSVVFCISLPLFFKDFHISHYYKEHYYWIDQNILNTSYFLKADGLNILLVLLTTLITPIAMLASWNSIQHRVKEFFICMLVLETGMLGALLSFDILLFYFFWELMLIPMYFIIGVWGSENRIYAALKFVIFTVVGSLLMFLAILWLGIELRTFNLDELIQLCPVYFSGNREDVQIILFLAFAISFAIKVPMFPFHTWLPDAHVQAPTAGSVILASVLLKMGTYGFIRFAMQLFPYAAVQMADIISILAIIGIIYGALMSIVQTDVKKLVAYSSISHLGFIMLGLFAITVTQQQGSPIEQVKLVYQGLQGAMYQMLNHGLSTGALFLLVGVIYERRHTKAIAEFGGLARVMPVYAVIFMFATLSSIGLPGLNGFIGEFLILVGSFTANNLYGILASTGVVLGAVYMLWLYQRMFFGAVTNQANKDLKDLDGREILYFVPIIILIIIMGVFPDLFLSKMDQSLTELATKFSDNISAILKIK